MSELPEGYGYKDLTPLGKALEENKTLQEQLKKSVELLEVLVKFYIANPNTKYEFISCITPRDHNDSVWIAWDNARNFIAEIKK